ncbi:NADPH-dependent FMN reductase [Paraburkholderia sp. Cpub6]|uniref:NADPH-dependent FMN reductase n=1 Tax=Paraburkholderia sp. Cpub6 TaxID=2723094 RepID=UPI00160F9D96|nr:NAD(P)H-dependent oxidoreductase [Paraburkholderia sp. Cpub6]
MVPKVLSLCGSVRRGSLNRRLLDLAARGVTEAGGEVTFVNLADYPLPFYDAELEADQGVPEAARRLQQCFAEHHGLLVASPEYNGGYTALLKNAIDWVSRPLPDGCSGVTLVSGKAAAIVSASPGPLGGLRSQSALRTVLDKLGMLVVPESFALGLAHEAWGEDGRMRSELVERQVVAVGAALHRVVGRLN